MYNPTEVYILQIKIEKVYILQVKKITEVCNHTEVYILQVGKKFNVYILQVKKSQT